MLSRHKRPSSNVILALLATGVLYFVLDLSASDRGVVDYVVIAIVICGILWNLILLGRRMYEYGGGKALWHVQRTVLFWIIGLGNTVWGRPEYVGTWRNWLGWLVLVAAICDSIALFRRERSILEQRSASKLATE
jgi:hypothetical protein